MLHEDSEAQKRETSEGIDCTVHYLFEGLPNSFCLVVQTERLPLPFHASFSLFESVVYNCLHPSTTTPRQSLEVVSDTKDILNVLIIIVFLRHYCAWLKVVQSFTNVKSSEKFNTTHVVFAS